MRNKNVDEEPGSSKLGEKVALKQFRGEEITAEAFQNSEFKANLESLRFLSTAFDIAISESLKPYKACFLCMLDTRNIFAGLPMIDNMYPISLEEDKEFKSH